MADEISRRDLGFAVGAMVTGTGATAQAQGVPNPVLKAKKKNFADLAAATVRIVLLHGSGLGSGLGSGYHFLRPDIVVSNAHVVLDPRATGNTIQAQSEKGNWDLKILASSPPDQFDFAIMRASGPGLESRAYLRPDENFDCERGEEILFAGYPHGIEPLLVAGADITSPRMGNTFSFDGMVHGGNSGGPIVDAETLRVKGTVTARRFLLDPQMSEVDKEMAALQAYLQAVQGNGSVALMGVDFAKFADAMSRIASLTNAAIRLNSTTGIGIGNSIEPVARQCMSLGVV